MPRGESGTNFICKFTVKFQNFAPELQSERDLRKVCCKSRYRNRSRIRPEALFATSPDELQNRSPWAPKSQPGCPRITPGHPGPKVEKSACGRFGDHFRYVNLQQTFCRSRSLSRSGSICGKFVVNLHIEMGLRSAPDAKFFNWNWWNYWKFNKMIKIS